MKKQIIKIFLYYVLLFMLGIIFLMTFYYFGTRNYTNFKLKNILDNKIFWILNFIITTILFISIILYKKYKNNFWKEIKNNKIVNSKLENIDQLKNFSTETSLFRNNSGFAINFNLTKEKKLNFNILDQHHMLVIGTTGIGKSQSIVIPNIIANICSKEKTNLIIFDPKNEIYETIKKYIDNDIYDVIQLDFINFNKSKWNPFDRLSKLWHNNELLEFELLLDNIVEMFTTNIKSNKDPIWHNASLILLRTHIICILLCDLNILVPKLLIDTFSVGIDQLIKQYNKVLKIFYKSDEKVNIFKKNVAIFLDGKNKMLPSIYLMTLTSLQKISSLNFFQMSNNNDIDFRKNNSKAVITFINVDPFNNVYWPLASLFIYLTINDLIKINNKDQKTLFILDEFGNLPIINNFSNIISVSRSYNIFFMLIVQSFNQIEQNYNDANNIFANINYNLFLHTNDIKTAKTFSKKLGNTEIININNFSNDGKYNLTNTIKPVIDEYDLTMLEKNQAILKSAHHNPILISLLPYYKFQNLIK